MLSGTTGRLKDIESSKLRFIDFLVKIELHQWYRGWFDHKRHWLEGTNSRADHGVAINIAERELLVLGKIIIYNYRPEVMYIDEAGKAHSRLSLAMKIKMFYKKRYAQQLMKLGKSEHVDGNKQYAGETFQGG